MAGTVKLPGIGEVKTGYAVAGGAAVFAIVGYAYYKHAQAQSAANAAAASSTTSSTSSGIDPATGYPYGSPEDDEALQSQNSSTSDIDPETGYPYGSPEDQEALQSLYSSGTYDTGTGDEYAVPASTTTTASTNPTPITTNSAWLNNIIDTNNTGYSTQQIIQAVTAWFSGVQISTSELSVIQTCEALYGNPPVALPAPNVSQTPPTSPTPTGNVAVPNVTGQTAGAAHNAIAGAGLIPRDPEGAVKGESSWKVVSTSPAAGTQVAKGSDVTILAERP